MSGATVDTRELRDALEWVAKAVPTRPTAPVLSGIRFTFAENGPAGPGVTLTAFNYETGHSAHVSGMVDTAGEVLVSGFLARDLAITLKGDTVVLDAPDGAAGMTMRAGRTKVTLPELPLEDYPTFPPAPPTVGRVKAGDLLALSRSTWWACGRDEMLPALTGIHLVGDADELLGETTNRFVISRRRIVWDQAPGATDLDVLLPGRHLSTAVSGLRGGIEVGCDDRTLRLSTDSRTVTMRLLDAEFPKINALFPRPDTTTVAVEVASEDLVGALARSRITLEPNQACLIRVTEDAVEVNSSGKGAIAGAAGSDVVDADVTGIAKSTPSFEQGFNPLFLADAVASVGSAMAHLWFTAGNKPALVRSPDEAIDALVMPRRPA